MAGYRQIVVKFDGDQRTAWYEPAIGYIHAGVIYRPDQVIDLTQLENDAIVARTRADEAEAALSAASDWADEQSEQESAEYEEMINQPDGH